MKSIPKPYLKFKARKEVIPTLETGGLAFPSAEPTLMDLDVEIRYDNTETFSFAPNLVVFDKYQFVDQLEKELIRAGHSYFDDDSWQIKSAIHRDRLFRVKCNEPIPVGSCVRMKVKVNPWIRKPTNETVATMGLSFQFVGYEPLEE